MRFPKRPGLTENLTRITFGYIGWISLVALMAAVLNVEKRFGVAAFAPVLLNVAMIGAAWALRDRFVVPVTALAIGVIVGGVAQFLLLVWALRRVEFHFIWDTSWRDPNVRRVLKLMVPALFGVSAAQISLLINTQIASTMPTGTVSWLSYADRLMEFPTALLGVAAGTIILPSLVRHHADADTAAYSQLLDWGLRVTVLLALPAALALGVLATPLVATLFHHGRFSGTDVAATQAAVMAYGVGLLGLIVVKILAPAFYARQEISVAVKCSLASLVFTQLCNAIFILGLHMAGHVALALSVGLGACANAALLYFDVAAPRNLSPRAGLGKVHISGNGRRIRDGARVVAAARRKPDLALRGQPDTHRVASRTYPGRGPDLLWRSGGVLAGGRANSSAVNAEIAESPDHPTRYGQVFFTHSA